MPGIVRPVADERDGLLAYLAQQRYGLRTTAYGLSDEEASDTPTASALSIAGLIKHVARTERRWIVGTVMQREVAGPSSEAEWGDEFRLKEGETLAGVLAYYSGVAEETESLIAKIADLEQPVPVPWDVPWFPADVEHWSVRWVLLHLIEETARHAGHADIIRETLDGRTMFELMDAADADERAAGASP